MAAIVCYTKSGKGTYPQDHYPGHIAWNADWEMAMHLAWEDTDGTLHALRNNTGILFAKAAFDEGDPKGVTKVLCEPWLFRDAQGHLAVCAVIRNREDADTGKKGCVKIYTSLHGVRYTESAELFVPAKAISFPTCMWDVQQAAYVLTWQESGKTLCARTLDFTSISVPEICDDAPLRLSRDELVMFGDVIPGNRLEISKEELAVIRGYLDDIHHIAVDPVVMQLPVGTELQDLRLPRAICRYSDGSVHEKNVLWDQKKLQEALRQGCGNYVIPGQIQCKAFPFPMPLTYAPYTPASINDPNMHTGMSDPCVTAYHGKFYLSSTGNQHIVLRCADRPEDTFQAPPKIVCEIPLMEGEHFCGTWAAELHEIGGTLYMLTALCRYGDWTTVQSVMIPCFGDPMDPSAWGEAQMCVTPDGNRISRRGISLDMTYFEDAGKHYVLWSNRFIYGEHGAQVIEPAELDTATIDPRKPWVLTSEPVCIAKPDYGWDRYETEVDEGAYVLRHGQDLLITFSGSSTGMGDLYNIGLLRAKSGENLLNPDAWEKWPYPLLTKESVEGEFGPGHNNFVQDPETGDWYMVYHAIPHGDAPYVREPAMRRVHMAKTGLPYLEMTAERDLKDRAISMQLTIVPEIGQRGATHASVH